VELLLKNVFLKCDILSWGRTNRLFSFLKLNFFKNLFSKFSILCWLSVKRTWGEIKMVWLVLIFLDFFFLCLVFMPKLSKFVNECWVYLRCVESILCRSIKRCHYLSWRSSSLVLKQTSCSGHILSFSRNIFFDLWGLLIAGIIPIGFSYQIRS
jgi:hypothetical protein